MEGNEWFLLIGADSFLWLVCYSYLAVADAEFRFPLSPITTFKRSTAMNHSIRTLVIRRVRSVVGLGAAVLLVAACSSTPPAPTSSLTAARDAIANAEQSDARRYAGSELDEAKQELIKADTAVEAERMEDADLYAQRARVTAELAKARTEAAKAAEVNREMTRGAEALIEEMQRSGDSR